MRRALLGDANALRMGALNLGDYIQLVVEAYVDQKRKGVSGDETAYEMSDPCAAGGAQSASRGDTSPTVSGPVSGVCR